MRKILFFISSILLFTIIAGCGAGGSSSGDKGSSRVSITIGGNGQTVSIKSEKNTFIAQAGLLMKKVLRTTTASAAIPQNVTHIVFTISAPDINTITRDVLIAGQSSVTEAFIIPNGNNRHFRVEAKDSSGAVLFRKEATANLEGVHVTLTLNMEDVAPPVITSVNLVNVPAGQGQVAQVTIDFSEPMQNATLINPANYSVSCSGDCSTLSINSVSSTDNSRVTLTLSYAYACYMTFDLTVSSTVTDLAGNPMTGNYAWNYFTGCF